MRADAPCWPHNAAGQLRGFFNYVQRKVTPLSAVVAGIGQQQVVLPFKLKLAMSSQSMFLAAHHIKACQQPATGADGIQQVATVVVHPQHILVHIRRPLSH